MERVRPDIDLEGPCGVGFTLVQHVEFTLKKIVLRSSDLFLC
jgi:hypothetical protein